MRRARVGILGVLGSLLATGAASASEPPFEGARLLLLLTIDQARYDYLVRFRPVFQAGLKRLLERAVSFTDAHHHHAVTATAPGHAALVTGLHPSRSGLVGNEWYDRVSRRPVYSVEDPSSPVLPATAGSLREEPRPASAGRSPRNLLAPTIADWIQAKTPGSKAYAVGTKDRSAVTLGGKSARAAFWFDSRSGCFITSRYYLREYPRWLAEFHRRAHPDREFGKAWEPLPIDPARARSLGVESVSTGVFRSGFPHLLGDVSLKPDNYYYSSFSRTPFMDAYLADLATALIENESLGADQELDFLSVSFAATDAVGHDYGPDSPEALDVFLRLDRVLGELLDTVERRVGSGRVVIALSADHGVMPLPELRQLRGQPGRRLGVEDVLCLQGAGRKLGERFGEGEWLLRDLYLDYQTIAARNLRREEVEGELKRLLEGCASVARAWTRSEIETSGPPADPFLELYRNSFHPERSPDLFVQFKEYILDELGRGTTHGSPYAYDTHVPLLIVHPALGPAEIPERVHTVDLAPTLASLLGVPAPGNLDGVDRSPRLRALLATAAK
jgi:hypothetical protein